jgi:hypothetical protein
LRSARSRDGHSFGSITGIGVAGIDKNRAENVSGLLKVLSGQENWRRGKRVLCEYRSGGGWPVGDYQTQIQAALLDSGCDGSCFETQGKKLGH